MLDIDELRALRAVCETGGFTSAARALNLTQSTISHQIRRLETRVGRRLFERTTRSVRATVEGELLLLDANRILDVIAKAESRLSSNLLKGEIRLGVPEEVANSYLPEILSRFRFLQPDVRIAVTVGLSKSMELAVNDGDLDMAVLMEVPARAESLAISKLVWVGKKEVLSQSVLPVAFFPVPCELRECALRSFEKSGRSYEIVMTSTSHQSLRAIAGKGLALTMLARSSCPSEMRLDHTALGLPGLPELGFRVHEGDRMRDISGCLRDVIHAVI